MYHTHWLRNLSTLLKPKPTLNLKYFRSRLAGVKAPPRQFFMLKKPTLFWLDWISLEIVSHTPFLSNKKEREFLKFWETRFARGKSTILQFFPFYDRKSSLMRYTKLRGGGDIPPHILKRNSSNHFLCKYYSSQQIVCVRPWNNDTLRYPS